MFSELARDRPNMVLMAGAFIWAMVGWPGVAVANSVQPPAVWQYDNSQPGAPSGPLPAAPQHYAAASRCG